MTVQELIDRLAALPEPQRRLPVVMRVEEPYDDDAQTWEDKVAIVLHRPECSLGDGGVEPEAIVLC